MNKWLLLLMFAAGTVMFTGGIAVVVGSADPRSPEHISESDWLWWSAVATAVCFGGFLAVLGVSCGVAVLVSRHHRSAWGWACLGPLAMVVAAMLIGAGPPAILLTGFVLCPLGWLGAWLQHRWARVELSG